MSRRLSQSEAGLTLIEVIISVVIVSMITGALTSIFLTAIHANPPATERAAEANDAQTIQAFLVRDAQAAGGSNPGTGAQDTTIGVSTPATAPDCNKLRDGITPVPGTLVVRFTWIDRITSAQINPHVANYFFDSSNSTLRRVTCVGQPLTLEAVVTLGTHVGAILPNGTALCDSAACPTNAATPALPALVQLTIQATNNPINAATPYTYTLTASTRPQGEATPTSANSTQNPLITLDSTCPSAITDQGSENAVVYGGAGVNQTCSPPVGGSCPSCFNATGGILPNAIGDPYVNLPPPNGYDCTNGPFTTSGPGTYKTLADATFSNQTLPAGIYIFCQGVTLKNNITANGVLFYIVAGTFNGASNGSNGAITMSPGTDPVYGSGPTGAGITIWQAKGDATLMPICCSNTGTATITGTVYAPSATVQMKNANMRIERIVALNVLFGPGAGTHSAIIGDQPTAPVTMTTTSLPAWTAGRPYPNTTVTASGGSAPSGCQPGACGYTFTPYLPGQTVSTLPANLSLDPSSGVISGTPTTAGSYSVTLTVTDSIGEQDSKTMVLLINPAPTITGPASLPSADIGRDYPPPSKTAVMTSTGGTAPYTWSDGGTLPPGLTIDPASGAISGNPTTLGTYSPTITLKDGANATTSRTYTNGITISRLPSITAPTGSSLPSWTTGQSGYSQQITVTDGTGPFTWQLSGGPAGLSINNSGLITGTPTGPQTYSLVVTATDVDVSASRSYSLTIDPGVNVTANVPDGEINVAYSASVSASGGTPPYTYSWSPVPPGLTLNPSSGAITGTPTVANTYSPVVTITDSGGAVTPYNLSFVINPAPTIKPPSPPSWTKNQDYTKNGTSITTMSGTGGLTPYTWSDGATLPPGLAINSTSGQITGSPTTPGSYTVVITLTDKAGVQATQTSTVTINDVPTIATGSPLPDGEQGVTYSTAVTAAAGTPFAGGTYKWAISSGPASLTINVNSGVISGNPTAGAYTITVVATDAAGATASAPLQLNVRPPVANGLSLSNQTGGGSFLVGTTVYYQGSIAGSFTLNNNISTGGTPTSSNFSALGGTSTGWTSTASNVSTPAGGPYVSTPFSWTAGTTSAPTESVTGHDSLGGIDTTTLTFVNDSNAPTRPVITLPANGAHYSSTAWGGTITGTASDAGSGLASVGVTIKRSTDNNFWNGATWQAASFTLAASGTSSWSQALSTANLTNDASYTVTAQATDQVGNTSAVATSSFTYDQIAGIVVSNITTSPSPALARSGSVGSFSYSSTGESNNSGNVLIASVSLVDSAGNPVTAGIAHTIDLSTSGAGNVNPSGAGVLTINAGTSTSTASFTLTRNTTNNQTVTLTATLNGSSLQFTVTLAS